MPQFNQESFPSQLFWMIITFLVLYILIAFIILPRIRSNIRLRKNKISNDLERATAIRSQIEKMVLEYNKKIEEANERVNSILKKTLNNANAEFNEKLEELNSQTKNKILVAEQKLSNYRKELENEINLSSNKISKVILNKVLYDSLGNKGINGIIKYNARNLED